MSAELLAAPAAGTAVRVRGAVRSFGAGTALDGIDLDLEPGAFTVLLGPSGSGKTTLLRAVAGIERLDRGEIAFDGRVVTGDGVHLTPDRRDLAMVFQDYALWPHLTVLDNVAYPLRRLRLPAAERRSRAHAMLERVGLGARGGAWPHELSGGQQQRIALARALVARPALLLFDEPLSNLDADLREQLRVEISTLARSSGASVLYITHDQQEAFALADDVVVLNAGRVVQRGRPEEVYAAPADRFVARFTGIAGTLTVTAGERTGDRQLFHLAPGVTVSGRDAAPIEPGTAAELFVRAGAARFGDDDHQDGSVPGVVLDVAYRGTGYEHVVETAAGRLGQILAASPLPRGARCTVMLDAHGCHAFA